MYFTYKNLVFSLDLFIYLNTSIIIKINETKTIEIIVVTSKYSSYSISLSNCNLTTLFFKLYISEFLHSKDQ